MRICPMPLDVECQDARYKVIHMSFLLQLLSAVICPRCHHPDLSLSRPHCKDANITNNELKKKVLEVDNCDTEEEFHYLELILMRRRV